MSIFSNSLKTWLIDPTVDNSKRTEYRLPQGNLASSWKLVDVGMYSADVTAKESGVFYNSILGVLSTIQGLAIYSGATLIDEIQELAAFGSVQHLRCNNQVSEDLSRFELLNGISVGLSTGDPHIIDSSPTYAPGCLTMNASSKDYCNWYNTPLDGVLPVDPEPYHHNQFQIANQQDDATSGTLLLSNYLQFLESVPVLQGLPDLRLVITWNQASSNLYLDDNAVDNPELPTNLPHIRPQLMVEEILGLPEQKGTLKIPFLSTMVERFVVPAIDINESQAANFRSGSLRQRFVKDLLFFNKVTTDAGWVKAASRSPAMKSETLQLVLDGRKYLPNSGIVHPAMKLQYFNDTFGQLNLPFLAAMSSVVDKEDEHYNIADDDLHVLAGQFSVTGVNMNAVVNQSLEVQVTRLGANIDAAQAAQYTLLMFARVNRLLEYVPGGPSIRLSY